MPGQASAPLLARLYCSAFSGAALLSKMAVQAHYLDFPVVNEEALRCAGYCAETRSHMMAVQHMSFGLKGYIPVSYTHLDVYKRQPSSLLPSAFSSMSWWAQSLPIAWNALSSALRKSSTSCFIWP